MCSKVRMIAALAVALALAAGAAQALPRPTHRPQPVPASAAAGLVDAARAWLASWFSGTGGGRFSTVQGRDGTFIDPNGFKLPSILSPPTLPTVPQVDGSTPNS